MANEEDVKKLLAKVEAVTKEKKLDLSSDEDLSVAIMNLISIEEHLYFTYEKTGKSAYLDILNEVRMMRKDLLKRIIVEYEGEVWCISKHLLSSSMRMIEVGTKALAKNDKATAKLSFDKAYRLYSLFWALNLASRDKAFRDGLGLGAKAKEKGGEADLAGDLPAGKKGGFFNSIIDFVSKAVDCCKE